MSNGNLGAGAELDIEGLMARIREKANGIASSASQQPALPTPARQPSPTLYTEEDNLHMQAEFNHSVLRTLGLLSRRLQETQANLTGMEERFGEHTGHIARLSQQVNAQNASEQLDALSRRLDEIEAKVGSIAEGQGDLSAELRALDRRLVAEGSRREHMREQMLAFGALVERHLLEQVASREYVADTVTPLAERVAALDARLESLSAGAAVTEEAATISDLQAKVERLEQQAQGDARTLRLLVEHTGRLMGVLEGALRHANTDAPDAEWLAHSLDEMRMETLRLNRSARELGVADAASQVEAETQTPALEVAPAAGETPAQGAEAPFDYFKFEHEFRGTRADIKQRQAKYADLFRGRNNVLDIGCGRGEFLELMREQGVTARGVDVNVDMVDFCQAQGLDATQADMFEYLAALPDGSLDGIFISQVVEHITPAQIQELVRLFARKLSQGGVVVAETVNPSCPEAMGEFYLDPTHVRPVPARMLAFVLHQSGFNLEALRFSAPVQGSDAPEELEVTSGWPDEVRLYQDYAVIATKK